MKKVLINAPCSDYNRSRLEKELEDLYEISYGHSQNQQDVIRKMKESHIIIGEPDYEVIKECALLEWVQMTWAGTDKYTLNGPFPENVVLTNASGAFGVIISEYILAGILALYRNLPYYYRMQQEKKWAPFSGEETIYGKKALILGTGNIGTETAKRLKAFDCKVYGIRRKEEETPYFDKIGTIAQLPEWISQADLVICAMPNNAGTMDLLDYELLKKMKRNAVIVNVGRGKIFKENALEQILLENRIQGAVLDVQRQEPLEKSSPFWELENVILTPHIAGPSFSNTKDTENRIYDIVLDNLKRYHAGQPLRNMAEFIR